MTSCEKCGLSLPAVAEYCPNCGTPVKKKIEAPTPEIPVKLLETGLLGAFLAIIISFFIPEGIEVYFIPSFLGAVVAVFLLKTRRLDEALLVTFAVYIFTDAIIRVVNLTSLYFSNMSWIDLANEIPSLYDELYSVPSLVQVIAYAVNPVSAIIAAYLGYKITPKSNLKEAAQYHYKRREEQGGIVYFVDTIKERLTNITHNI